MNEGEAIFLLEHSAHLNAIFVCANHFIGMSDEHAEERMPKFGEEMHGKTCRTNSPGLRKAPGRAPAARGGGGGESWTGEGCTAAAEFFFFF